MEDFKMKNDVDELLSELEKPISPEDIKPNNQQNQAQTNINSLTPQELKDFVIRNTANSLLCNNNLLDLLRLKVMASCDSELITAFANLLNANSKSVRELNNLVIQEEKRKIEEMKLEGRNIPTNQTNILIISREEALKLMQKPVTIDIINLDNDIDGMKIPDRPNSITSSDEILQLEG